MTKILIVGDVHGDIDKLCELYYKNPTDLILQTGDFETIRDEKDLETIITPKKYRRIGDYPEYYNGTKKLPVETIFIGGNHESWGYLDQYEKGGQLIPNLYYLGRAEQIERNGIKIAGITGIYSKKTTPNIRKAKKHKNYYLQTELDQIKNPDILLTHEWPEMEIFSTYSQKNVTIGSQVLKELIIRTKPKYAFCGHMHYPHTTKINETEIYCLSIIGTEGDHKIIEI